MMDVAVIGLGAMGAPIARNLAKHEHQVTVFDLDPDRVRLLADEPNISGADSAGAAAANARIVHVIVFTDAQVREVIGGADGVLNTMRPGSVAVIHSTAQPATCRQLAAQAGERKVDIVDAGMTGAAVLAEAGRLTLLVGGDTAAVELCRPEFEAFAANVVHLGDHGTGLTGKILNNLMVLANAEVVRESLEMARAAGVTDEAFFDFVGTSTARSWASENWPLVGATVTGGADPGYAAMSVKDCALASELTAALRLDSPIVDVVSQRLQTLSVG